MRLIWYNRDEFSDLDMRLAKSVADRLLGKKEQLQIDPIPQWGDDLLKRLQNWEKLLRQ